MAAANIYVPWGSPRFLLPLQEALKDQQVSDPGSSQTTASALGLGACETLYAPFKGGLSV